MNKRYENARKKRKLVNQLCKLNPTMIVVYSEEFGIYLISRRRLGQLRFPSSFYYDLNYVTNKGNCNEDDEVEVYLTFKLS